MTALATPPVTGRPARTSPHLLRWLLRLHRPALLVWAGFVLVLGALLLWVGGPLTDGAVEGWKQYHACESGGCAYDPSAVVRFKDWYTYTTIAVLAVPVLVAAWAGAALTSRELEHGTAQLAWTQSISPARWLAAKLALPAVLVTVGSALLVGLHHWAWSTGQGRLDSAKDWFDIGTYAANGPATAALALAGLATGALFGLLKRNSLVSLVGSLCATAFLWGVMALATPHLWPTVTKLSSLKNTAPAGSGIVVRRMTALATAPTARTRAAGPIHAVLRLQRGVLIMWAVIFTVAAGALLWAYGPGGNAAAADWKRKCSAHGCDWSAAISNYHLAYAGAEFLIGLIPYFAATLAGAVIGRELENGTAQLAWTQGISPTRWLATTLAVPAALITAGSTVLVLLHRLLYDAHKVPVTWNWWNDETFIPNGTLGIVLPLLGLAVGALAGLLQRRLLTSIGLAFAATALALTTLGFARPHLWPWATSAPAPTTRHRATSSTATGAPSPPPAPTSPTRCAATARRA
jgi:hypothetical protein